MLEVGRQRTGANRRGRPSVGAGDSAGVLTVDRGSEIHLARKSEDGLRRKMAARDDQGRPFQTPSGATHCAQQADPPRMRLGSPTPHWSSPSELCRREARNSDVAWIDPRPTWRPMPCGSASRTPEDVGEGLGADASAAPIRPLHPRRGGVAQFTIPAERKGPRSERSRPFAQRFARSLAPETDLGRLACIRYGPAHGRRT